MNVVGHWWMVQKLVIKKSMLHYINYLTTPHFGLLCKWANVRDNHTISYYLIVCYVDASHFLLFLFCRFILYWYFYHKRKEGKVKLNLFLLFSSLALSVRHSLIYQEFIQHILRTKTCLNIILVDKRCMLDCRKLIVYWKDRKISQELKLGKISHLKLSLCVFLSLLL